MDRARTVGAAFVALLAGIVGGLSINLWVILYELLDMDPDGAIPVFLVAGVVVLAINPLGTFLAGYVWGVDADVPDEYYTFFSVTLLAALAGYVGAYTVSLLPVTLLPGNAPPVESLFVDAIFGLSVVTAGFAALAGSATGHFRSGAGEG